MTDIAEFNRLVDGLKQKKNYKKDELVPVHEALMGLQVDESAAEAVCRGLAKLQWMDAVTLLAAKWSDVPPAQRHVFVRWRWDEKDKDAVIEACVAMAARIHTIDTDSATKFLEAGVTAARGSPNEKKPLVRSLRKSWIDAQGDDGRTRLEQLNWDKMADAWRWDFINGCVEAVKTGASDGKAKSNNVDPRKIVSQWLTSVAQGLSAGSTDHKRLSDLAQQLTRTPAACIDVIPAPTSVGEPPTAGVESSSPKEWSERGAVMGNREVPAPDFDRVVAAAISALQAVQTRMSESRGYSQPTAKEVATLQRNLQEAIDGRKVAEAATGQLRRDVDSERARAASLQSQVEERREELRAAREQIASLESKLEVVRGQLQNETTKVMEITKSADDKQRKHVAILETERQEARRVIGERIAHALLPDLEHFHEIEQDPPSADQAKFLRALITEMFKRLRALDVPVKG